MHGSGNAAASQVIMSEYRISPSGIHETTNIGPSPKTEYLAGRARALLPAHPMGIGHPATGDDGGIPSPPEQAGARERR